jgi:mono/diheme cytochrome c family protein
VKPAPALVSLSIAVLALAAPARAETVWDGVYSAEQAARGDALYGARCAECHGAKMEGTMSAPALADIGFLYVWDGLPVAELFAFTKTMMPPTGAGSLSDAEVADMTAAILAANGYPAGAAELPADPVLLSGVTIAREE